MAVFIYEHTDMYDYEQRMSGISITLRPRHAGV